MGRHHPDHPGLDRHDVDGDGSAAIASSNAGVIEPTPRGECARVLAAAVLISSIGLLFHITWSRRATALGPTILTTLGIFFCFAGIAWGLLDFDANDVRSSVPHLLGGIRTSFWASVVGIFWALTLKIRVALFGDAPVPASGAQEGSTVDDLARLLVQLDRSIAGGDDSALLGQVQLCRA